MLTRFHKVLIALLVVQLVLVVIVMTRGDDAASLKEHPVLAGFDAAKVTRIQIFAAGVAGAPAKPIDLVKRDAAWVLASAYDYPVDATKVTDLLSPLAKMSAAAPIATQAGRHKQLHVGDAEFERKLVITRDGKDLTLYVGNQAGVRHTAVRVGGTDNVFSVTGISAAAIGSEARAWVDPVYAKTPNEEIAKITVQRDGKTVELVRPAAPATPPDAGSGSAGSGSSAVPPPPVAEHWSATIGGSPIALATGESLDDAAIDRLVGHVATIDVSSPADPKRDASRPTATITIERKPAGSATPAPVVIDVIADGASYWVHDRALPRAALVDKSRLDDVVDAERDKLVKKPAPPSPAAGAVKPGAGAAPPGAPAVHPGAPATPRPG